METEENTEEVLGGAFVDSLKRSNKSIKDDRATAIGEDAEMAFKRCVEDLSMDVKRKKRERENMLDLSPTNAMSLMVANDFDEAKFVDEDIKLGVEIRLLEIKLDIAQERYNYLFKA